jgi:uncharacterized protein (TIGR02117 family)
MGRLTILLVVVAGLLAPARPGLAGEYTVHLVNIGWHTGIAMRRADIDPDLIPEIADLPDAGWIEFGWGDAAFYRDPDPALATYFSAAFTETPAVMHLAGLPVPPDRYFPKAEIIDVPLDAVSIRKLLTHISASFARARGERLHPLEQGLYRQSWFYDARGTFTLSNTCNTWVAQAFAAAGLDIDTDLSRAGTVTQRVRAAVTAR